MGLIVAAILAATLSSIDSMLNSLAAVSIMDWYKRLSQRERSPTADLRAARLATAFWGLVATGSALAFGETESIVELVNMIGSYFYGTILGIFLLYWIKPATGFSALTGLVFGFVAVLLADHLYQHAETGELAILFQSQDLYIKSLAYLWLNPIGTLSVVISGTLVGIVSRKTGIQ
jgi:Na+/proline symporter